MTKTLISILLFSAVPSITHATTKAAERVTVKSSDECDIRAVFREASVIPYEFARQGSKQELRKIFWTVDVETLLSPGGQNCPSVRRLQLRVRGADARRIGGRWQIDYPVHLAEPARDTLFTAAIVYAAGHDSYTGENYQEWFVRDQGEER